MHVMGAECPRRTSICCKCAPPLASQANLQSDIVESVEPVARVRWSAKQADEMCSELTPSNVAHKEVAESKIRSVWSRKSQSSR